VTNGCPACDIKESDQCECGPTVRCTSGIAAFDPAVPGDDRARRSGHGRMRGLQGTRIPQVAIHRLNPAQKGRRES
jgi:hypothetical protein